ncbi:hypothetical protein GQ53DRAFT_662415 [Thozetella sp. PMI_491]|nr:hypothetical protein GQ53DRAFT_662415 [Thozetella sp. PMI_491]
MTASRPESPRPLGRKHRRITRACDDCRRKKIKCDGRQPCKSCAEFNSKCTYDRPSGRTRGSKSNKEMRALEKRLHRAESLLRQFMPHLDLEASDSASLPTQQPLATSVDGQDEADGSGAPTREATAAADNATEGPRYIPLVDRIAQLSLTDTGEYVFHGLSSGAAFLGRITQQFPTLFAYDPRMPFLPQPHRPFLASPLEPLGGLPVYSANPWWQANYDYWGLPPRELAHALCEYSFSRASCILKVVHAPTFWKTFNGLYQERPQRYTYEERRFVGLLFSIISLGSMYDVDENDPTNPDHYAVAMDRGYKYYISARRYLQDITECSDMTTLQSLVFIVQFLQATGNLGGCHTLLGIALRSALRMGLHRHLPHSTMTPIEDETRRRVFHTIRQLDVYLSTTLGLPLLLQDKDIDQPWPTEVDDEYITESAILRPPPGTPLFLEAFTAHAKLMRILAKVVEHLYPPKGTERGQTDVTYMISCARIREIEQDLHNWHEQLPATWRPGPEEDTQITRVKILLRFAYGHVQMMLYRPFLQFHSRQTAGDKTIDDRQLVFATAGINVCRNIIHIGLEIRRQAVLIGPYWFITYTQFFAVLSVVLYVLHNPDKPGAPELFSDAKLGKDCISGLTQRSQAADRVDAALNALFDQLPSLVRSTEFSNSAPDSNPISNDGPSNVRSAAEYAAQQPVRPRAFTPQEQWRLQQLAGSEYPASRTHLVGSHGRPAMQALPVPRSGQAQGPMDVMGFPMDDPFAYPLMPGVSLGHDTFASLHEDAMRLPLFNMHAESHIMHPEDPSQVPPTSVPVEPPGPHAFNLWDFPNNYGSAPF